MKNASIDLLIYFCHACLWTAYLKTKATSLNLFTAVIYPFIDTGSESLNSYHYFSEKQIEIVDMGST